MDTYEHDPRLEAPDVELEDETAVGPEPGYEGEVRTEGVDEAVADLSTEDDPNTYALRDDDPDDELYDDVEQGNPFKDPVNPRAGSMNDQLQNLR